MTPKKTGLSKNPTWVSVHSLRTHVEEGSEVGSDDQWLDIESVRREYTAEKRAAFVAEIAADQRAADEKDSVPVSPAPDSSSSRVDGRPQRSRNPSASGELLPSEDGSDGGRAYGKRKQHAVDQAHTNSRKRPAEQEAASAIQASVPFSVNKKTFEIGDSLSFAISCLQSLDQGDYEHPSVFAA